MSVWGLAKNRKLNAVKLEFKSGNRGGKNNFQ
jgi:hypothetical protein